MEWLAARTNDGRDPLTTEELKEFTFDGERFLLMDPQRGIRKPAVLASALAIRTVYGPGRARPRAALSAASSGAAVRTCSGSTVPSPAAYGARPTAHVPRLEGVVTVPSYPGRMETSPFLPLTEGRVAGTRWSHRVHDLGVLRVPSGRLEASDPFVNLGESFVVRITPGDYPVRVTVADVSDEQNGTHLREAYLSVVLREGTAVRAEALTPEGRETAPEGEFYGVGVDAGTVGFADADAVSRCMPTGDWYNQVFDTGRADSWFGLMDSAQHLIPGCANVVMPAATAGENVVLCHSGWGDGFYPVVGTFDAESRMLAVHIDLQVDEVSEP